MGQKTHPTGFRIGVNKKQSSNWYADYKNFNKVLKEDYLIRKLFETEFENVYDKASYVLKNTRIVRIKRVKNKSRKHHEIFSIKGAFSLQRTTNLAVSITCYCKTLLTRFSK